jgi:hypothetical protein
VTAKVGLVIGANKRFLQTDGSTTLWGTCGAQAGKPNVETIEFSAGRSDGRAAKVMVHGDARRLNRIA